jgi:hypothetical protein
MICLEALRNGPKRPLDCAAFLLFLNDFEQTRVVQGINMAVQLRHALPEFLGHLLRRLGRRGKCLQEAQLQWVRQQADLLQVIDFVNIFHAGLTTGAVWVDYSLKCE